MATFLMLMLVVALQLLYTAGAVFHFFVIAYKSGSFDPHTISFGRTGVFCYLIVAIATASSLWVLVKRRGGARNAKLAALFLAISLASTIIFVGLIATPYSDVVSR
ncbi:hypothetical protein [Tahibacter caeni]|uniref:hypothetical protein n=1 Tax=Tahibacter caeni TaxID=1453545 RepID=UPI0021496266|nr:hypothetical protein [Tahibacter caeni]